VASRGKFITLEGGEGAGKSTQTQLLVSALAAAGIDALATREPGGAPSAEEIRALLVNGEPGRWDPMTEALLHFAARHEHLRHTLLPALTRGIWVVSDRFADSTMAYQGYGHGLGRETIEALSRTVLGDFEPDLTIILDIPADQGLARAGGRGGGGDRYERMELEFHQRLRQGFLDIAKAEPDRCAVVDGTASIEETQAAIRTVVGARLRVTL
jgi:dTMP kinase